MSLAQGFNIFINRDAGTVQNMGESALEHSISQSKLHVNNLHFLSTKELFFKVKAFDGQGSLLIGGGDGTLKACAEIMMNRDKSMGIVSMGTMNLLARDLNIPTDITECLDAYAAGTKEHKIDIGIVNDEIFLCCAGYGTMPETSKLREKHRSDSQPILIPRLTAYVLKQMDRTNRKRVQLSLDGQGKTIETSALVISNNKYRPQDQWSENNFLRSSLQEGVMGIYSAAPYSFWDKVRLLSKLGMGNWQKDTALKEWSATSLTLETQDKNALVSLDGEAQTLCSPLHFSIRKKALSMIIPQTAGASS